MTTTVRHTDLVNTTGAAVVSGGALAVSGQDYALEIVSRTLAAADIGTAAGQTKNAAGMIFAEFNGSVLKAIVSLTVFRAGVKFLGATTELADIDLTYVTADNVTTVSLHDGAVAAGVLAAGDVVVAALELGNS